VGPPFGPSETGEEDQTHAAMVIRVTGRGSAYLAGGQLPMFVEPHLATHLGYILLTIAAALLSLWAGRLVWRSRTIVTRR
jgi:hypothetical protein